MPRVISAQVPLYPRVLQAAHFEGDVRLRLATDGMRVSSMQTLSGAPLLAKAATDNVKTWEFAKHEPAAFETVFHYRLVPSTCDDECNCGSVELPTVSLRLPTEVYVNAEEMRICDPGVVNGD